MPRKLNSQLPTFEVTLWNLETLDDLEPKPLKTVIVKPISLGKLTDARLLQEKLIKHYVEKQGSISELLTDEVVIADIESLAALLPVVGRKERGIDLDNLLEASDYVQIAQIFFTESFNANVQAEGLKEGESNILGQDVYYQAEHRYYPKPSLISKIHDFLFFQKFQEEQGEAAEKARKEREDHLKTLQEDLTKMEEEETNILTPKITSKEIIKSERQAIEK